MTDTMSATMRLPKNSTLRLPTGALVHVERGLLVVTREGDPDDHVLRPGMELRLPERGRSVGWALEASRVQLSVEPAPWRSAA
jgi:hypothetical protein